MNPTDSKKLLFQYFLDHVYQYRETPFTLASGKTSKHYFNCKEITLHPLRMNVLLDYIVDFFLPKHFPVLEAVGGLTLGADALTYGISGRLANQGKLVFPLVVRKEAKDHGTGKKIEGNLTGVKSCLVLEDVVTTGGSSIKAIDALRDAGIRVDSVLCILDRQEGGEEMLKEKKVKLYSIFQKSDFMKSQDDL